MNQVITFEGYTPSPRYDGLPWTSITIEEGATSSGPWTIIDTQPLSPVDADPTTPAARNFTTDLASDLPDLWYRVVFFDAAGDDSQPTVPIQNTSGGAAPFSSITELERILKIRQASPQQHAAMLRVLTVAAGEIRSEIDLAADDVLEGWEYQLCASVNLDRAADLWRHTESVPGVVGIPDEAMPTSFGRYSWERYAQRLAPLKRQWGLS